MFRCWDFSHSKQLRCWDFSSESVLPLLRFFPLGGLCMYTPLMGFFPLGDGNADWPTCHFSISLRESKPSVAGIFSTWSPYSVEGFFLSETLFDVPLMRFSPTWKHGSPHLTHGRMNPRQLPSVGSIPDHHSVAGIFLTRSRRIQSVDR